MAAVVTAVDAGVTIAVLAQAGVTAVGMVTVVVGVTTVAGVATQIMGMAVEINAAGEIAVPTRMEQDIAILAQASVAVQISHAEAMVDLVVMATADSPNKFIANKNSI
jgi:hypothetical protein